MCGYLADDLCIIYILCLFDFKAESDSKKYKNYVNLLLNILSKKGEGQIRDVFHSRYVLLLMFVLHIAVTY